jgi:hypothetical protein
MIKEDVGPTRHQTQTTNTIPTHKQTTPPLRIRIAYYRGSVDSEFVLFSDNLKNWLPFLQQKYTIFLP